MLFFLKRETVNLVQSSGKAPRLLYKHFVIISNITRTYLHLCFFVFFFILFKFLFTFHCLSKISLSILSSWVIYRTGRILWKYSSASSIIWPLICSTEMPITPWADPVCSTKKLSPASIEITLNHHTNQFIIGRTDFWVKKKRYLTLKIQIW